ncbi:hypothetical protein HL42_4134 [Trichophyton rubrum]|nr:hypothetical protein HL42_4134 [Trichophyton rubrum]
MSVQPLQQSQASQKLTHAHMRATGYTASIGREEWRIVLRSPERRKELLRFSSLMYGGALREDSDSPGDGGEGRTGNKQVRCEIAGANIRISTYTFPPPRLCHKGKGEKDSAHTRPSRFGQR